MIDDFVRPKPPAPRPPASQPMQPAQAPVPTPPITAEPTMPAPQPLSEGPKPPKQRKFHIWPRAWSRKKKRIFTALLLVILLALGGSGYWYQKNHQAKPVAVKQRGAPVPVPTTVASPLTGAQVTPALAQRAVSGVMIENSPDARPQSGLNDAGVVYEAVAEGGITRFLALFQEANPAYVGPIRSSRPYYLDWLVPFDASYAHVGGSPEALQQIKDLHVKDLDQFANGGSYDRVTSRYAPHNVYTSIDKLYDLAQKKGYGVSKFTGFARKAKEAPVAVPTAKTIDLTISSTLFNVHYDYDAATNSYLRSEGGKPHTDEKSTKQLAPKVVVGLVIPSAIESDGSHNSYNTTGTGMMYVFQDGTVTQGTWSKSSRTSQFVFNDSTGQPLKLNPGQTWISVVSTTGSVVYKP